MTEIIAPAPLPPVVDIEVDDALELPLSGAEQALLDEAQRLTGTFDAKAVLLRGLRELVERERFLAWVERKEAES